MVAVFSRKKRGNRQWCRVRPWVAAVAMTLSAAPVRLAAAPEYGQPGPHAVGERTVSVPRPGGGSFTSRLYYPALTGGLNAPLDPAEGPYPAISFGHGFVTDPERYRSTLEHLASWGYLVMATESSLGLLPNHATYAQELSLCLTYLETENTDAGSFLFNQVDIARFGMSGHSMGGGASILATAADTRVRALVTLAANETNPSAISAVASVSVPICLLTGDSDGITNWQQNSLAMYNNASAPRQLPLIRGGYHCGFLDSSILFCDSGSISRAAQLAITRRTLTAFFQLYLKGDQEAWSLVWGPAADADADVDASRRDPGISLTPAHVAAGGFAGRTVVVDFLLKNTGPEATSYAVLQEGATWPTMVTPVQTELLSPDQTEPVQVSVTVPEGVVGLLDSVVVSARSDLDGGTRGFATVETRGLALGDCDGDGDVDLNDYIGFEACLAGPAQPTPPGCACFDLDEDGPVTLRDFGVLQVNFGGA